jgi:hypothetical protein
MNRTFLAAIAILAVLVLAAVVASGVFFGPQSTTAQSSAVSSSTGSTLPGGSSTTASNSANGAGSPGTFSMLATDPPVYASGVSKIFVKYSGEDVHTSGSAAANAWVGLNSSGTIELTSLVNTTQTIASSKIKSGAYDMARLDISSATVLYNGQNYTASVPNNQLAANMSSQLQVNSSAPSAALIDLHTVVVNGGNSSQPQFLFSASAKAAVLPSSDASAAVSVGARLSLTSKPWWGPFIVQSTASLKIASANVTSTSLSLIIRNTGGANTTLRMVTITPASVFAGVTALPPTLTGSATFLINQDGSLTASTQSGQQTLLQNAGASLAAGSSAALTYKGTIQLGKSGLLTVTGVLQGQQYLVTVISSDSAASLVVAAG